MGLGSWIRQISLKQKLKNGNMEAAYELANMNLSDASSPEHEVAGMSYLLQAAKGNVIKAQCDLAKYYLEGKFGPENTEAGMHWLLAAADNGSKSAWDDLQNQAARMDTRIVFQWLEKYTAENSKHAYLMLGNYYCSGIDGHVPIYYNLASEAYHRALNLGIDTVELSYDNFASIGSYFYYQDEEYERAVYWCNIAANVGNTTSRYILGRCYFDGTGVKQDFGQAFQYFKQAAESGMLESKKYLGKCYMEGLGTLPDAAIALQLFHEVSSLYPEVFNYIGQYYIANNEVAKAALNYESADAAGAAVETKEEFYTLALYFDELQNYEEAVHWLNLSSKKNTFGGYFLLAQYYLYGRYFEKDVKKGIEMLEQLSEKRYQPALRLLYNVYDNGVEAARKDKAKAFICLTGLAELGDLEAIKMVGSAYMQKDSDFLQQDYEQAAKWYDRWYDDTNENGSIGYEHLEEIGQYYWGIKEYKSADKWLSRAAEEGSAIAHHLVGKAYFEGIGVKRSIIKPFKHFKYAAEKGISESKVYLGRYYVEGLGRTSKNPAVALQLFNEVSSLYPVVYNFIGKYFIDNKDVAAAALNYEKAEEAGVAEEKNGEFYDLALYYDGIQNYEKAVHWLSLSSKKDTINGRFLLAQYYFYGRNFQKDQKKAVEIFDQLSEKGYEPALFRLYNIYNSGEDGIEPNKGKAFSKIARLAELGNTEAIKMMGSAYMQKDNSVMPQDYVQATLWYDKWYKHKNRAGNVDALHLEELGQHYVRLKDNKTANLWFLRAVEAGAMTAYVSLGFIASGEGDNTKAFQYFAKAAEAGVPDGLAQLANCYYAGKGTSVDYALAYKNFTMAADKESRLGLYGQAFCLMNNIGVTATKEDDTKIFTLLSKAAEMNSINACEMLSNCYELGIGTEVSVDKAIYYLCRYRDDENLLQMVWEKDYVNAYEYVKDKKEYFYHKMLFTYFGKGTACDKTAACEMFISIYRSNTLNDICGNYATRPAFKYRIAKDVIEEGIRFERDRDYEKAIEYYKAALRFNPKAGLLLARLLFEKEQCDALPLLYIMSNWEDKDGTYRKCRSAANNMLGLYYEYFYTKVANDQTAYTKGYRFETISHQNVDLMMKHYTKSAEEEAYKRICSFMSR